MHSDILCGWLFLQPGLQVLTFHEDDFPSSALARSMDLYNNNVGISYGPKLAQFGGNADLFDRMALQMINEAVKNGEMRRFRGTDIGVKTSLVKTNSTGAKK
jgi:hypothetical protein